MDNWRDYIYAIICFSKNIIFLPLNIILISSYNYIYACNIYLHYKWMKLNCRQLSFHFILIKCPCPRFQTVSLLRVLNMLLLDKNLQFSLKNVIFNIHLLILDRRNCYDIDVKVSRCILLIDIKVIFINKCSWSEKIGVW